MRTPLHRIRNGALILVSVVVLGVLGYRWFGDYEWLEALWMVVITISTVGYGERSALQDPLQWLTIFVILFGMSAAAYTFSGLIQLTLEGELERIFNRRRMTREIDNLRNHVVICGYGRTGRNLANDLNQQNRAVVVIDSDPQRVEEARSQGVLCVEGDATDEDLLRSIHIDRAVSVVTSLPSDADNVFITLTARNLSGGVQIIATAQHESTAKKLRQAGADKVVMPAVVGARQMVRMITRPTTADLMELVGESSFTDLELDELLVSENSRLAGSSIQDAEVRREHRLLVVAVKQNNGQLILTPDSTFVFNTGDTVMLIGQSKDIDDFRTHVQG